MALATNGIEHLTMDDLLEAINPSPRSVDTLYRHGLDEITLYWQQGRITSKQATNLVKMLIAAKLEYEVGEMVADAFSPKKKGTLTEASHRHIRRT